MSKLMGANLMRLKKDKIFWICAALMAAIGAVVALVSGGSDPEGFAIDRVFFTYAIPLEFACAVFCSLFIGTDYNDGAIRNKIVVGHSRLSVYLANFLTCALAGLAFACAYIIPMLAIGIPRLGFFAMGTGPVLMLLGISLMMMLAVCAIFTLISMLCQNKAFVAVICLVGLLAMLFGSAWLNSRLHEPEVYDSYVYTDNSGALAEAPSQPNPNYLSGAKRDVFLFLLELQPAGQALLFADSMSFVHPWLLPLYSLLVVLLTGGAGLYVFRRKDLR